MNTVLMKRCPHCQKKYPATTEYFYSSHLKEERKNRPCKTCHTAGLKKSPQKRKSIQDKLIEAAQHHDPDQTTIYAEPIEKDAAPLVEYQQPIGTPFQCGACGTTEGNIICDVDTITKAWRGYLCASCHRSVRLIRDYLQGDPQRIPLVLAYVEQTSDIR